MPGSGMLDRAEQEAERHAQADGDVAELGGALDRVAEELAQGREIAAIGEHADAIAELEHEVGPRQEVGVAAANVDHDAALSPGRSRSPSVRPTTVGRDANTRR